MGHRLAFSRSLCNLVCHKVVGLYDHGIRVIFSIAGAQPYISVKRSAKFSRKLKMVYSRNRMRITLTVKTEAQVKPTRTITPLELYEIIKTVAGNTLTLSIEDSDTVQQLANAADALMNVDPNITVEEKLMENDVLLSLGATLADSGVKDGDVIKYSYVIIM